MAHTHKKMYIKANDLLHKNTAIYLFFCETFFILYTQKSTTH